ncbi:MAG: hypothetical protein FJ020_08100 [Chloroflexi bacterium]|nr:hypothetical protein [Chloroflexota bacterium]
MRNADRHSNSRPLNPLVRLLLMCSVLLSAALSTSFLCEKQKVAPTMKTQYATNITATAARLNGDLITMGTAAQVKLTFQWGTRGASYDREATVPARTAPGLFYLDVSGLEPNTTYYFRAVAAGDGKHYGAERSFKTAALP